LQSKWCGNGEKTPPDLSGCADDCGIVGLPPADCARMTEAVVMYHGILQMLLLMNGQSLNSNH
jgi:hypothetical protein